MNVRPRPRTRGYSAIQGIAVTCLATCNLWASLILHKSYVKFNGKCNDGKAVPVHVVKA